VQGRDPAVTESLEVSNDIDQIRRELKRVSEKIERVGKKVEEVDSKVDRSNATQLGTLATALVDDGEVRREVLLAAAGMNVADIAAALGKSENAVRIQLHRARKKAAKGGKKS
jgi:DNA-directed RNA polymerase specialized sigma24 family protein